MDFPRRIFIALGEPSDVSSVASDDLRRQDDQKKLQDAIRGRQHAEKSAKELADKLDEFQTRNEALQAAMVLFVIIFMISIAAAVWLWVSSQTQPPPALPDPQPRTPAQPSEPPHDCRRGCGPPYYWEYESHQDFECWRDRSIRGPCF